MQRTRRELLQLSGPARRDALVERIRAIVAAALGQQPSAVQTDWINPDPTPLFTLLQSHAVAEFGFPLYPYDLPYCGSISRLAEHIAAELIPPPAPSAPMGDLYEGGAEDSRSIEWRYGARLERPIVFLLSAPRSGSTLLSAMLGRNPKLYAASELSLLPFESMAARGRALNVTGPWARIGLLAAIRDLSGTTNEQAQRKCIALEESDVAVSTVYARLQELAGNRILLDKSPAYAMYPGCLARAERVFRAPLYIHLTRHPGAAIESFVRMRFHRLGRHGPIWDDNPWTQGEKVWTSSNLHIHHFLRDLDRARHLRVSYEALMADPAGVLTAICKLLEIPFDPNMLDPYAGLADPGARAFRMGDPGFFGHSGIDPSLASDWQAQAPPQKFGSLTCEVAASFGYEIP